MIKKANSTNSLEIFNLISPLLPNNFIVKSGSKCLRDNLRRGNYISFVKVVDNELIGHIGVLINKNFALIDALAIREDNRNKGYAKSLVKKAVNYCNRIKSIDYIVTYVTLNNSYSEKIFDNKFKPVGISFIVNDSKKILDLELALCKLKNNKKICFEVDFLGNYCNEICKDYKTIGIKISDKRKIPKKIKFNSKFFYEVDLFNSSAKDLIFYLSKNNYIYTGLLPSGKDNFKTIGFIKNNFKGYKISYKLDNVSRRNFILQKVRILNS